MTLPSRPKSIGLQVVIMAVRKVWALRKKGVPLLVCITILVMYIIAHIFAYNISSVFCEGEKSLSSSFALSPAAMAGVKEIPTYRYIYGGRNALYPKEARAKTVPDRHAR